MVLAATLTFDPFARVDGLRLTTNVRSDAEYRAKLTEHSVILDRAAARPGTAIPLFE